MFPSLLILDWFSGIGINKGTVMNMGMHKYFFRDLSRFSKKEEAEKKINSVLA